MGKNVGEIKKEERCGTLRMGLFFDGTGNDDQAKDAYSNVKKLFDVYPNNINPEDGQPIITDQEQFPHVQSAYIRGVGSRSKAYYEQIVAKNKIDLEELKARLKYQKSLHVSNVGYKTAIQNMEEKIIDMETNPNKYLPSTTYDTLTGGALGVGGIDRLQGMLWLMDRAIHIYKDKEKHFPKYLEFDIYGFSRGAALARHFVNVLKQEGNWWSISEEYSKVTICTLNLFDTVGSMIIPGRDLDPGYTYFIKSEWIQKGITHIIADDEYRYNFDGQFIESNDKDYPVDHLKGKVKEYVEVGAHSDIGGGYTKEKNHGIANNDLAKVYLNKMYDRGIELNIPYLERPRDREDWKVIDEIKNELIYFSEKYKKYPTKN